MKAILEFNLPDDQTEFDMAVKAGTAFAALNEFGTYLRNSIKHGNLQDEWSAAFEEVRKAFFSTINDHELGGLVT